MAWRVLADLVVALHFAFIVFVTLGGFLAHRWPRVAWLHAVALAWGTWILASGAICPLTPLENTLHHRAGGPGYEDGFMAHYLIPVIYPAGLTREAQWVLGVALLAINFVAYGTLWRRRRRRSPPVP